MSTMARAHLRKGWCPGVLRPMTAKDGLLVRLRITGGIVPASTALALAGLAEACGNGVFDLSARANLQMRGIRESALPTLLDGLRELRLLDADAASEAVRNVLANPLAGLGNERSGAPDLRPLAAALEARLTGDEALHSLSPKFGFVLDDGGALSLADVHADIRFDWRPQNEAFGVGLGGTARDARRAGRCAANDVVDRAVDIARRAIATHAGSEPPKRMHELLSTLGSRAVSIFALEAGEDAGVVPECDARTITGLGTFDGVPTLGLAAPFGRLDAGMLRLAANLAEHAGLSDLRLTPWRTILIPHIVAARVDLDVLRRAGFIINARDPRLSVTACVGATGCTRGTTSTHRDATMLADLAACLPNEATPLHVSGCEKGCAKPFPSAVTLVGRASRYDLVRNGHSGDRPLLRGLDLAQVRAALLMMPRPA